MSEMAGWSPCPPPWACEPLNEQTTCSTWDAPSPSPSPTPLLLPPLLPVPRPRLIHRVSLAPQRILGRAVLRRTSARGEVGRGGGLQGELGGGGGCRVCVARWSQSRFVCFSFFLRVSHTRPPRGPAYFL